MRPAFEALLDQALRLPVEERGELAARLLRSLEPDDGEEPGAEEWEAMWSAELDHRIREIRDGGVELVDGDDVLAELREIGKSPRPGAGARVAVLQADEEVELDAEDEAAIGGAMAEIGAGRYVTGAELRAFLRRH